MILSQAHAANLLASMKLIAEFGSVINSSIGSNPQNPSENLSVFTSISTGRIEISRFVLASEILERECYANMEALAQAYSL